MEAPESPTSPSAKEEWFKIDLVKHNIVACLPVYRETADQLKATINSFLKAKGVGDLHLVIILDGYDPQAIDVLSRILGFKNIPQFKKFTRYSFFETQVRGEYIAIDVTFVVKFENKGKHDSQILFFDAIQKNLIECSGALRRRYPLSVSYSDLLTKHNLSILFVDSDTSFDSCAVASLFDELWSEGNRKVAGATGYISPRWKYSNFIEAAQNFEYWDMQHLDKSCQSFLGLVLCLPGAFCLFKMADFFEPSVVEEYRKVPDNILDLNRLRSGEDRLLTTLLLRQGGQTRFLPDCHSFTTPPSSLSQFFAQRKRWNNSVLLNQTDMLTRSFPAPTISRWLALSYTKLSALAEMILSLLSPSIGLALAYLVISVTVPEIRTYELLTTGASSAFLFAVGALFAFLRPIRYSVVFRSMTVLLVTLRGAYFVCLVGALLQGRAEFLFLILEHVLALAAAVLLGHLKPSLFYCFVCKLLASPIFILAHWLGVAKFDDTSWGTRGLQEISESHTRSILTSARNPKYLFLVGLWALNSILAFVFIEYPMLVLAIFIGVNSFLRIPRFVMALLNFRRLDKPISRVRQGSCTDL